MTLEQEIMQILADTREQIRANMSVKGINASGRTSDSLRVEQDARGMRLVGGGKNAAPIPTLEFGRGAGRIPGGFQGEAKSGKYAGQPDVSNLFKHILIDWAKDKGIADFGWGQATSLGRRIAYEGTLRHVQHEDVYSTPVMTAKARISEVVKANFANSIRAAMSGMQTQTIRGAFTT